MNELCKKSAEARRELDNSNMHRLLELHIHSITALGHARNFAELLFEAAHQPLEQAIQTSYFRDSHIQGMKHSLANDWRMRVSTLIGEMRKAKELDRSLVADILSLPTGEISVEERAEIEVDDLKAAMKEILIDAILHEAIGRERTRGSRTMTAREWRGASTMDIILNADLEALMQFIAE